MNITTFSWSVHMDSTRNWGHTSSHTSSIRVKVNDPKASAEGCWCSVLHVTTQTNINTTRACLLFVFAFLFLLLLEGKKLEREGRGREIGVENEKEGGRGGRGGIHSINLQIITSLHIHKVLHYCTSKS